MSSTSTPSLTTSPSRSPSPSIPVQPDHFYRSTEDPAPTPNAQGWFDPEDDLLATRGIPVFKPTMDEFRNFEEYMNRVECWGSKSGIVKIIPPKEWTDALPPMKEQLNGVKIKTPIEQQIHGTGGHFRQENMEKRKYMSVREWVEHCAKDEYRAPGVSEVGLRSGGKIRTTKTRRSRSETGDALDDAGTPQYNAQTDAKKRQSREANQAAKNKRDAEFLETFQPHIDWLPPGTIPEDYTPKFCEDLARQFWRNCGIGKPPWYGADSQGSLFTDETESWNVAHLDSALSRLLPASDQGLPGVNTPYLYWGMWRATFAWHVEDMDLFSINYIHFGAPKFWYAIPQGRASPFEQSMKGLFPTDGKRCSQFLRHKQFLVSPSKLAKDSCAPNHCVQQPGEFMITYPRGYHAGFNLGLNCAESVNFALDSWIAVGRTAKACECVSDSVRIDVDQLIRDRQAEAQAQTEWTVPSPSKPPSSRKTSVPAVSVIIPARPKKRLHAEVAGPSSTATTSAPSRAKKARPSSSKIASSSKLPPKGAGGSKLTIKLGPRPEVEHYPCCLCVSSEQEGLLPVLYPPYTRKEAMEAAGHPTQWLAHRGCADVIPETWVDEMDLPDGRKGEVVCGVEWIVKDRWNLKCTACTKTRAKAHGAPIQCTKGKCLKAFHVSCAKAGQELGILYRVLHVSENEVVLKDPREMHVDPLHGQGYDTGGTVLKIIKKTEVEILCTQHNPDVAAAKKASKLDKIRKDLLALPPSSLIRIRISAGLFEVSLLRVIEERGSVEVVWDRDAAGNTVKREFKWGSVLMGNADGAVIRKTDVQQHAPLPAPTSLTLSVPSQSQASTSQSPSSTIVGTPHPSGMPAPSMHSPSQSLSSASPNTPYGIPSYPTAPHPVQSFGGGWYAHTPTHGGPPVYGYNPPPPPPLGATAYPWQHTYQTYGGGVPR